MRLVTSFLCAAALWAVNVPAVQAGAIEQACRNSERAYQKAGLCSCIQKVANKSLTRAERSTVSKWFANPHQAQVVRQSDRRQDEQLWERYKAFGETAARACG
ncbi:hypothetical protein PXK00_11275 [Phaeobacter sp. QD34_3]|uniref:hypothetical protein n=1 Tax=unclassified Phaeobacter TaxID=2621772 RepID=UPI00237FD451|nr:MULTISPECIES: hypothetical protein [unclassified Phaeobacter]MDE4133698.1 hypothetical protein [Phaeobacter sp. QD34_3]MDE4137369.1 hypothetical protein [Phaeobacter sp. QD34_24]MDE4176487.1 hypothetical protein [Phaeobacter sp. PT47_59]